MAAPRSAPSTISSRPTPRNPRDGRFNERIGFYNPVASGQAVRLSINEANLNKWIANGAKMSETVSRLYKEFKKTAAPAA